MKRGLNIMVMSAGILLLCGSVIAAEPAEKDAAAPAAPTMPDLSKYRDPFWPPYPWRPPPDPVILPPGGGDITPHPPTATIQWDKAKKKLRIAGFGTSQEGKVTAYIVGKGFVQAGDFVSVEHDRLLYRWKVTNVTSSGITTTRLDVKAKK